MNHCAPTAGYYPHEAGVTEIDAPEPTVPAEPAPETLRVPAPPDNADAGVVLSASGQVLYRPDGSDWLDY